MSMTPEAKSKLSTTIRNLRERLLTDLKSSAESTYQFALKIDRAKLTAAQRVRRGRIDEWVDLEVRTQTGRKNARQHEDFRRELEKQAAYTLLNRMVILRLMESMGLRPQKVATGGWNSSIYKAFREIAATLVNVKYDENEGLAFLLQMIFEELALDMPGLYGPAGAAELIPIPPATLRAVIEAFDDPDLESCWTDDMTLGWIYQYWNDPEREKLDAKINDGGKIEPHEIASKTQMFTERYMVDWLLQNSLGPMWLAMCQKHGWTPECEFTGTLDALEQRRVEWRAKRDAGEVELTDLMPLHTEMERRWAYYVPQPIPDDAVEHAPDSVRELKILDPAVGSGHFLVVAFDLLFALYEEEAKHLSSSGSLSTASGERAGVRGFLPEDYTPKAIVERIIEHNLHGIDLDPRAVQIAAAALWLKAMQACPDAHPRTLNLVASNLGIASLPDDDPALVELRRVVQAETGVPAKLTNEIVEALRGADHLGSLLKIDKAVDDAINTFEAEVKQRPVTWQPDFFGTPQAIQRKIDFDAEATRKSLVDGLESFLSKHNAGEDLGLRLRGEQLAAGVRFLRLVKEGSYDLVVANPPYQGTSKLVASQYIDKNYPLGKADLFAAFLLRGLELVRKGGVSSMLTMRNWMFIKQYSQLREHLLETFDLRSIGDFDRGAFEDVPDEVVSVAVASFANQKNTGASMAMCPTPREDRTRDNQRTPRKRAATLCQIGRTTFDSIALKVVPEWPLVYWWKDELKLYHKHDLLGEVSPARATQGLYSNTRFIRQSHEVLRSVIRSNGESTAISPVWVPLTNGANGATWIEPLREIAMWGEHGMQPKSYMSTKVGTETYRYANEQFFFRRDGVAYTTIGSEFAGRLIRYPGIFANKGRSIYSLESEQILCLLNSGSARRIANGLNPGVGFESGDVNRLPVFRIKHASEIVELLITAFACHELHREPSIEFSQPGPSPWRYVQEWAQAAVDRAEGEPLPEYVEQLDPEPPTDHLSFALGFALGRFGADGEGILDPEKNSLDHALPAGILFLDGTLDADEDGDGLSHSASAMLRESWTKYGSDIKKNRSLRQWLSLDFFKDVHKGMYENRPIHWPLSSAKKTFVAWVNIHRMDERTLTVLLADHLQPTLTRLDGELSDLTTARSSTDRKAAREADDRYADVKAWRDELADFIANVNQCALRGPAPADAKKPEREVDAVYAPVLDDGVMINSSALWPLLEPQWKEPKKWWQELVAAKGKKDYDWSHLAMRYWPTRVDKKCQSDPSLGVAHGCFWKYHPERAWAWELRLQDEIEQEFRIREEYDGRLVEGQNDTQDGRNRILNHSAANHSANIHAAGGEQVYRDTFIADHPDIALQAIEKELTRRIRKSDAPISEMRILEPGIWSDHAAGCYDLELKFTKKQSTPFRLIAPDDEPARSQFEQANPEKAAAWKELVENMRTPELPGMDSKPEQTPSKGGRKARNAK